MSTGQPASKLVYPLSHFGVAWILTTALLLAYTAIVTPPMISFHWTGAFAVHAHHSFLPASFCHCPLSRTPSPALTNSAQKAYPKLRMVSPARPALTQINRRGLHHDSYFVF